MPTARALSLLVIGAIVGSLQACSAGPDAAPVRASSPGREAPVPADCAWQGGELAVIAGEDPFDAGLYALAPCSGRTRPLTDSTRISSVASGGGVTAVAAAPSNADQVFRLAGDQLVSAADGLGRAVAVSPQGVIAYVSTDATGPTVRTVEGTRDDLTLRPERQPAALAFAADGSLLVAVAADDRRPETEGSAELLTVRAGEVARRIPLPLDDVDGLVVGPKGRIFVTNAIGQKPGLSLTPDGNKSGQLPAGWRALLISSGRLLMVNGSGRLGVFDQANPDLSPSVLPPADAGSVYGAAALGPS